MADKKTADFDVFYRMYAPKLYGVAFKMVNNQQDALDIVQESFIKAYKNWEKYRGEACVSTWLFKITLNTSYDYLRKKMHSRTVEMDIDFQDKKRHFGEAKIIKEDIANEVKAEIEKLTPKQKAVFILKTYDGLNYREIAKITNSRIGTVKATYFQVVQKLKKKLYLKEVIRNEL